MGLVLIQKGMEKALKPGEKRKGYNLKDFARDIFLSLVYTVLIIILVKKGLVKPIIF